MTRKKLPVDATGNPLPEVFGPDHHMTTPYTKQRMFSISGMGVSPMLWSAASEASAFLRQACVPIFPSQQKTPQASSARGAFFELNPP
jgi:hypothetical protein